jgi:hypothetical protein
MNLYEEEEEGCGDEERKINMLTESNEDHSNEFT